MLKKNYLIVVNDFRSLPVLAAASIATRNHRKGAQLLISPRFLDYYDYGGYLPSFYKRLKLYILKCFFDVFEVPLASNQRLDSSMLKGIDSSLQSITYDSRATAEKYPKIYNNLRNQALGAGEIADYISSLTQRPHYVFIFNGRTASASPTVSALHTLSIPLQYYEYSHQKNGYHVYPYPCHNSLRLGQDLLRMSRLSLTTFPERYVKGLRYRDSKLKNKYTENYRVSTSERFDIVVFLGSDHEYTNLQLEIVNFKFLGNIGLLKHVLEKYSQKKIAVRAHPNQQRDPNWQNTLHDIKQLCKEYNLTYFPPTSKISSYALIKNSSVSVVEYSSIAYDVLFLGSIVDVVGDLDLKAVISSYTEEYECAHDSLGLTQFVRETMIFYDELFFYKFQSFFVILLNRVCAFIEAPLVKFGKPSV